MIFARSGIWIALHFDIEKCFSHKIAKFGIVLAEGASAAYDNFKKSYYVNIIKNLDRQEIKQLEKNNE